MGSLEQGWKRKKGEEGVEEKRGTEGETHIGIAKEGWMIKSPPPFPPAASVPLHPRAAQAGTDRPTEARPEG